MVLLRGVGHLAVAFVHLRAHHINRFFLVLVALKHFLGLIQVVRGDLLRRVQRAVRDASWLLVLALVPLVENELLDAAEERLLVQRLRVVLVRQQFEHYLISHILISRFLVAVNTAITSSSEVQLLFCCLVVVVLVPHLNRHSSADIAVTLVLWRFLN